MDKLHPYLTTEEAADFLRYKPSTLHIWRSEARGPKYIKIKAVRYPRVDLEEWLATPDNERLALERTYDCHQERKLQTKRLRGRKGAEQRERRLANEQDCRDCLQLGGIHRPATEVDHIIPLSRGGTDDDENIRCLCTNCHRVRTAEQRRAWN